MRALKRQVYPTADQLDERLTEREALAASMPPSGAKKLLLQEIMQLRAYASMKRLLAKPVVGR